MVDEIDHLREGFERDGFVNGGLVLEPHELAALRAEAERFGDVQIRQQPATGPTPVFEELGHDDERKHYKMIDIWRHSDAFHRLLHNQRLNTLAAGLMRSKTLQVWADTVHYKPALNGGPVNWHQDGFYHEGVGSLAEIGRIISAWVALDDADEESGCMWMMPESHTWGVREPHLQKFKHLREREDLANLTPYPGQKRADFRQAVPRPVKAGEVHFHHALTWHASPYNRSPRTRRAYTMFLMADGVDQTKFDRDCPLIYEAPSAP